jgi:hypothetical protein
MRTEGVTEQTLCIYRAMTVPVSASELVCVDNWLEIGLISAGIDFFALIRRKTRSHFRVDITALSSFTDILGSEPAVTSCDMTRDCRSPGWTGNINVRLWQSHCFFSGPLLSSLSGVPLRYTPGAVLWFRSLFAGLSPRRPGFAPGSIHVGFAVDKVTLGQVFYPSSSLFPCQYIHHSTVALQTHIIWGMRNMLTKVGIHIWVPDTPHLQGKRYTPGLIVDFLWTLKINVILVILAFKVAQET